MFLSSLVRSHERYQEMLTEHLDGRLGPRDQARLQAHLAACPRCRQVEGDLRRLVATLRTLPMPAPPRSFALQQAPSRLPGTHRVRPRRVLTPLGTMQAATAVSALALMALVFADLAGYLAGGSVPAQPVTLQQTVAGAAERQAIQPAEQTSVAAAARAEPTAGPAGGPVATQEPFAEGQPATLAASLPEAKQTPEVAAPSGAPVTAATPVPSAPPVPSATGRPLREWLLLATALATATLALGATTWTWWLRSRGPR